MEMVSLIKIWSLLTNRHCQGEFVLTVKALAVLSVYAWQFDPQELTAFADMSQFIV